MYQILIIVYILICNQQLKITVIFIPFTNQTMSSSSVTFEYDTIDGKIIPMSNSSNNENKLSLHK